MAYTHVDKPIRIGTIRLKDRALSTTTAMRHPIVTRTDIGERLNKIAEDQIVVGAAIECFAAEGRRETLA